MKSWFILYCPIDAVETQVHPHQNGGFTLTVILIRRLLQPFHCEVVITDTGDTSNTQTLTTPEYSDVDQISYVVSLNEIKFSTFTLSVGMVQGRIPGPSSAQSTAYSKHSSWW